MELGSWSAEKVHETGINERKDLGFGCVLEALTSCQTKLPSLILIERQIHIFSKSFGCKHPYAGLWGRSSTFSQPQIRY
jgi:hypothetical protein